MGIEAKGIKNFHFANWSETFYCDPELYFIPENAEELREILFLAQSNNKRVRIIGTGHSPSDICCTNDYMVNLCCFNKILNVDQKNYQVKVESGLTFSDLNTHLDKLDMSFPTLGSVSTLTIAGAISTGTHGTGINYGIISSYIIDLELLTSSGDTIKCSRNNNAEIFKAALCGLGAIGIITNLTLQCQPTFLLHQHIYPLTLEEVLEDLNDQVHSCDYFRFLWFPHTNCVSVWQNNRVYDKQKITKYSKIASIYNWFWDYAIGYYALELAYWCSTFCNKLVPYINRIAFWLLYSSPRNKVDISYKIFNFECLFKQYVNEWSIPIENTAKVLYELKNWIDSTPSIYAHFPVEVRFVKGDDIYLSPAFGRDSAYINIIMYRPYGKDVEFNNYWRKYEEIMKAANGRPHWAKAHRETAEDFLKMYPYFTLWTQIRKRLDPINMLMNSYLDRIFLKYSE